MVPTSELEALWAGPFGDAYTERNRDVGADRGPFWRGVLEKTGARTFLEVGCNAGGNLRWLPPGAFGVDINRAALRLAQAENSGRVVQAAAARLPFASRSVDLVFTCATLIHVRRDWLRVVMDELAGVSKRWVLLMEHEADEQVAVPWRGQDAAFWRAPYGHLFLELVPGFSVRCGQRLSRDGFDGVTAWLFERKDAHD